MCWLSFCNIPTANNIPKESKYTFSESSDPVVIQFHRIGDSEEKCFGFFLSPHCGRADRAIIANEKTPKKKKKQARGARYKPIVLARRRVPLCSVKCGDDSEWLQRSWGRLVGGGYI